MISEKIQQNGTHTRNECPVCQTHNELVATHCKTCSWYFPMQDSPQFALELSRAKQQFQMVNTFNQIWQGMQTQAKMLEKISFRLDGMENELNTLKQNQQSADSTSAIHQYDYPPLTSAQKAEDFDTNEKRKIWWEGLEDQWQKAFNQAILRKANEHQPTDEELLYLLESPVLRFVGPRGMHPNMDFELTNLTGLRHISKLTILVVSHQAISDLEGVEHLQQLESLFANANKLTHIRAVHYLKKLKQLYVNVNQLTDIKAVESLTNLQTLYCCYNRLQSLHGITEHHQPQMQEFTCLPNDDLPDAAIIRVEKMGIKCRKG